MPHLNEPVSIPLKLTIPANTQRGAAVRTTARFQELVVITDITLHVPSGHTGLVPIWFELDGSTVYPTQGEPEYRLDDTPNFVVIKNANFVIRPGQKFELVGYNEDTANEHTTRAFQVGYILRPGQHGGMSKVPGQEFAAGVIAGSLI